MRLLDLIRQPKVSVTVAGDVLMGTMPGTTFSVTYENTDENRLVANSFHARNGLHENRQSSFSKIPQLGLDSC
jgi:hypothetical protein